MCAEIAENLSKACVSFSSFNTTKSFQELATFLEPLSDTIPYATVKGNLRVQRRPQNLNLNNINGQFR